jgi:hypothetical protein
VKSMVCISFLLLAASFSLPFLIALVPLAPITADDLTRSVQYTSVTLPLH